MKDSYSIVGQVDNLKIKKAKGGAYVLSFEIDATEENGQLVNRFGDICVIDVNFSGEQVEKAKQKIASAVAKKSGQNSLVFDE